MSKGLEALELLSYDIHIDNEEQAQRVIKNKETIEKELKQAEEDRKVLSIFKNALTIEHHEFPTIEHDDSEDVVSYLVKELYTIKQNELEKDMRKSLREWVLKNAFPKELKDKEKFEELVNMDLDLFMKAVDIKGLIEDYQKFKKALGIIKNKNFDLFYLQDSKDLEQYNDCCDHFRNLCYLTQEEYDLLKEVLICQNKD